MSIAPVGGLPAALATSTSAGALATLPAASSPARAAGVSAAAGATATGSGTRSTADAAATKAATQFERVLLEQLTKQLAATAAPDGDDASAATAAYRDLLPATMADALSQAGGIGIAAQLTRATATPTGSPS